MNASAPPHCPLCGDRSLPHEQVGRRRFFHSPTCDLVFLDPDFRLPEQDEVAHYGTHRNDPDDSGYRRFLSRLADPLLARLRPGAEGLDFGCGPGPALPVMLEEAGFEMRVYDPFFAPDEEALRRCYDFITATEVVEHLFEPARVLERLTGMLRPGGWLAIMTEPPPVDRSLTTWRYARDPTHVCFHSPATFRWIAERWGYRLEQPEHGVALLLRPGAPE